MLSDRMGKKRNEYLPDYVAFDLETTGISWKKDGVVEISAVKVREGKPVDEFSTLVNPGCPISPEASAVNGITDDMVEDSPGFDEALSDFMEFAGEDVLVGHNIYSFDMKFLYRFAQKYWGKTIGNDYVDTLSLSRSCLTELPRHRLTDLASHFGISTEGAHRALKDSYMTHLVYEKLGIRLQDSSARPLEERICPSCGSVMVKRNGKYGPFWGCTSYPGCRHTDKIED